MGAILSHCRHYGRRRRPGADHDHLPALVVKIIRPGLRMHDAALEFLHARPFRRVAFGMAVISLTHPQKVGGETDCIAGVGMHPFQGP